MAYAFRDDVQPIFRGGYKADPKIIGQALEKIAKANDGLLEPDTVVEEARSPRHPLHPHFDWDDTEAAEKWRREQARNLIQTVRITAPTESGTVRAYWAVDGGGYRTIGEIKAAPDLRAALIEQLDRELAAIERRCSEFRAVATHIASARKALKQPHADNHASA